MIKLDKVAHFVVSLILTAVLAIVIKSVEVSSVGVMCGLLAAAVTMCLGVAKEVWDKFRGTGFDLLDLAADALGCFIAVIFSIFMQEMTAEIIHQLTAVLYVIAGLMVSPILFVALDFWAGIRKARQRHEELRSDKMQRTLAKLSRYYNAILAMLVVDGIQITAFTFLHIFNGWTLWTLPVFTLIGVGFAAAVEIKSIMEPANAKEEKEMKEVTELAAAIAEHKSDPKEIAQAIAEYLKKNDNKE